MDRKGVTLIEVLVVVTILSVLALSLYTAFKSGLDAWSKAEDRLEIFQNARVVLNQLSRELLGATVDGDAMFVAAYQAGENNSDTVDFATNFAGAIYRIKYELLTGNILQRSYSEIDDDSDYTTATFDYSIDFGIGVNNIKLEYLPVIASPVSTDWDTAPPVEYIWSSGTSLPEAVKVTLTLEDEEGNTYTFETIAYLPNSE